MSNTDVLIVGGGTVGVTLARGLLSQTGLSVTLIDAQPFEPDGSHTGFDARVIALARRSVQALNAYGIEFGDADTAPISAIQVSDQGNAGLCELTAAYMHLSAFGEVVSLATLGKKLHNGLEHSRFSHVAPAQVENISQNNESVTVTLDNGNSLSARLLILADGGRSGIAQEAGFELSTEDYQQTALVFNARTSKPHNGKAYERFTPGGPLAFLPFSTTEHPGYGYSVVWAVPTDQAPAMMQLTEKQFCRELQQAFGYRQGVILQVSERHSFPLTLRSLDNVCKHRVAVVGNAAQTLHPIAGQGLNLGLRDVITLVDTLKDSADPGAFNVLRAYSTSRQSDRRSVIGLTDMLVRAFSNAYPIVKTARNLALIAMNNSASAKQAFVRQTTGYGRSTHAAGPQKEVNI